jgi:uncharacterized protein (TIGR03067 family)
LTRRGKKAHSKEESKLMVRTISTTLGFILLLILAVGDDDRSVTRGDSNTGDKALDGAWEFVSQIRDGKEVEPLKEGKPISTIHGESFVVRVGDKMLGRATIKVDPTRTPKTIDFMPLEGPNKGKTAHGIYEVKPDELRICYAQPGRDRPTEFASKEGSHVSLRVYKRLKR